MEERVAITGIGLISPLGVGREAFASALEAGSMHFVDEELLPGLVRSIGRVGEIAPTSVRVQSSKARQIDAISRYAVEACAQALLETGVELNDETRARTGVLLGTVFGCLESNTLFDQFHKSPDGRLMGVSPLLFKSTVSNAAAGWASILLKLRGVNATFTSGLLAGAEAVAHASDLISDGTADLILAGGGDRLILMNELLEPPPEAIPTEGMGVVALESMSRAVARGATVYGRLKGYWRAPLGPQGEVGLAIDTIAGLKLRPRQLGAIITSTTSDETLEELQAALATTHGIAPQILPLKRQLGECYGAWAGQAVASACLRLATLPPDVSSILVLSTEPGSEGFGLVVRRA